MINKIISIITFILIVFGVFHIMYLIQTSNDKDFNIKTLEKIVDKEIEECKSFKTKHIDSH